MNWRKVWEKRLRKLRRRRLFVPRKITLAKVLAFLATAAFVFVLAGTLILAVLLAWYARDLPSPDKVVRREGFATKIYDRNGESLYDIFSTQRRIPVELDQIPLALRQATIAIEDKNFYEHKGFDPKGILRAVYNIIIHHRLQGGSTLTQQLVKNVLLTQERVLSRKIREFIIAVQIESRYSKDQILQMYLNEAPYGGTAWGVQAASETYFGKKVSDLSLVESAILAGLTQKPSEYSPFSDSPKAYIGRTKQVLRRMREDGYIDQGKEKEALKELENIAFAKSEIRFKAPHFVMYIKKILEERYGQRMVEQGGLEVHTSLDNKLQEKVQEIVSQEIEKAKNLGIGNGAALVIDPQTGEILAMVGSKDYFAKDYEGQVNVTLSQRQPGSAIKPVTYLTALKKGYTAATVLVDSQTVFPVVSQPDYEPENYDGKFRGPIQVRYTLGSSLNIPAVKILAKVGIKEMLSTAYEMGLSTLEPTADNLKRLGFSVTLGGGDIRLLELVTAYSSFANTGTKVEPISILKVSDQKGNILEEYKPVPGRRIFSAGQAFIISNILSDNQARLLTFSPNSYLNISDRQVAVKTGTTNDKRDNWTIGWTPQVIVGVWVGNNDNSPMKNVTSGVSGAAPIWRQIILEFLKGKPVQSFTVPEDVLTMEVDSISGYPAHDGYPSRLEYFLKETVPVGPDPIHTRLKLCRGQDKLATAVDIARGQFDEKEFYVLQETDPVSSDGRNRWQEGIDSWIATQQDPRFRPPKEYCGSGSETEIVIRQPEDRQQIDKSEVEVKVEAISEKEIKLLKLYFDGYLKEEFNQKSFDKIYTLSEGPHTIKIEAQDQDGNYSSKEIKIGIRVPWDWQPSPTPTITPSQTPIPTPTKTMTPTPPVTTTPTFIPISPSPTSG